MPSVPCFSFASPRVVRAAATWWIGAACLSAAAFAADPERVPLWADGAPGAVGNEPSDKPSVTKYFVPPEQATGGAVVVFPGGGYGTLAMQHEGRDVAAWLNGHGLHAFVVEYRLGARYKHPAPLQDAQRAVRLVRFWAHDPALKLDPRKVGIWGFSAGGHLASTLATHFDKGNPEAVDAVEKESCRPDLAILAYPVISMEDGVTHAGSKRNLLGGKPDPALVALLSNETQVTAETPPTFLFHTNEDLPVPAENSLRFAAALRKAKVPCELHLYEKGGHGVGLAPKDAVLSTWPVRLQAWLGTRGFIPATK